MRLTLCFLMASKGTASAFNVYEYMESLGVLRAALELTSSDWASREIFQMKNLQDETFPGSNKSWNRIKRALLYVSLVDQNAIPDKTLVEAVDQLHQAVSNVFSSNPNSSITDVI